MEYHNGKLGGHRGREATYDRLEKDFWWPGMYEDVRRWCRACTQCAGVRVPLGFCSLTQLNVVMRGLTDRDMC